MHATSTKGTSFPRCCGAGADYGHLSGPAKCLFFSLPLALSKTLGTTTKHRAVQSRNRGVSDTKLPDGNSGAENRTPPLCHCGWQWKERTQLSPLLSKTPLFCLCLHRACTHKRVCVCVYPYVCVPCTVSLIDTDTDSRLLYLVAFIGP